MRILVFGAGVLGCNLAHSFFKAGKDVTLLARGEWGEAITTKGLTIVNKVPYYKTNDKINVIESLKPEDRYDIIFVVARFSQLKDIIPILNENKSKNIVLVGNNTSATEHAAALRNKDVLFAFSSSAGHRENERVISVTLNKMTIGSVDGSTDYEPMIKDVFSEMKYKLIYCNDMDNWLKSHAAFILPICFACYYTDGNLKKIKKDEVFLNKVIDATIEVYDTLKATNHRILPKGDYEYVTERKKYMKFLKLSFATFLGKIMASDHAMNAVDEMTALNNDFIKLIDASGFKTPVYRELATYINNQSRDVRY